MNVSSHESHTLARNDRRASSPSFFSDSSPSLTSVSFASVSFDFTHSHTSTSTCGVVGFVSEEGKGERETAGHEPFAVHAPIQWIE